MEPVPEQESVSEQIQSEAARSNESFEEIKEDISSHEDEESSDILEMSFFEELKVCISSSLRAIVTLRHCYFRRSLRL